MKIETVALISIFLFVITVSSAQEIKIEKCPAPKGISGKYKLLAETRPLGTEKQVLLHVIIKPKNFTKDYLTDFAKRINAEYCNEDFVVVAIFDSKERLFGWQYDYITSGGKVDRRRGTYILDRKKGEEGVEFSTKYGNPINEIKIEISHSNKDNK